MTRSTDFSLAELHAALDARRQARGLTWAGAMREINSPYAGSATRPVASATVATLQSKAVAEADGVLAMLRWLQRAPESFIPGLRIDTRRLHGALAQAREARGVTWQQVAEAIGGVSPAMLTGLKKGGRTSFPFVTRMTQWLGRPIADFVWLADQ